VCFAARAASVDVSSGTWQKQRRSRDKPRSTIEAHHRKTATAATHAAQFHCDDSGNPAAARAHEHSAADAALRPHISDELAEIAAG